MGRTITFISEFSKRLVSAYSHQRPRDTKVKENLSLAFSRLLSPVGDIEN